MDNTLKKQKASQKTYRHFSISPAIIAAPPVAENTKLEFFYIGKKSSNIDLLIGTFESGYAAENTDHARTLLKRLVTNHNNVPDVIVAEGSVGIQSLILFRQFLLGHKQLNTIPFFVEGSQLSETEILKYTAEPASDDVISLHDLTDEAFIAKIGFWKKIKQRINAAQQPMDDDFTVKSSPGDLWKRAFDIVISLVLMAILSPVFLLIMIALRIESKGPVFYISKRAGRGYKIFKFYKFRTMVAEANSQIADFTHLNLYNPLRKNGPVFIKIDNDPRITKLGAFLRKCVLALQEKYARSDHY